MKILFLAFFFIWNSIQQKQSEVAEWQAVTNKALNGTSLAPFLTHYSQDTIYFRFAPNSALTPQPLSPLRKLALRIGQGIPLVYNQTKDEKLYPVVVLLLKKLDENRASISVGIPIEGAVGQFTLTKDGDWKIESQEAYEN